MHTPEPWPGQPDELALCRNASLPALIRHLLERYHRPGREALDRVEALAGAAAAAEGSGFPVLLEVRDEVVRFAAELRAHFKAEERDIFPALLAQECGEVPFSGLDRMRLLEEEHKAASGLLGRLDHLTGGFQVPAAAGPDQRALLAGLGELVSDLRRHIWLENHLLFRQARSLVH